MVILMLDTARPDYLSAYGHLRPTTPFLERFAAEGARFDRAYSSSS
ncbi:MAG: sulfatase-like hydrolase/transferase [Planctomycetes bacterium]|nr:sulfatase-like hydrolase/transferase [Planctomycetota bacterium]